MKTGIKAGLLSLIGVWIIAIASAGCQAGPTPANATSEVVSGRAPNASVEGTVTYRERLALTPDASLVVELRDVSYADGDAPLIARQTVSGPGQVPIGFRVEYNREDIDPTSRYSVSARILESDGRLAFTNDTAYEVITQGNPDKADMVLVLVEPPPDLVESLGSGPDWRTWIEVPAPIVSANLMANEPEHVLRIVYLQSTIEGCARPGSQEVQPEGNDIVVRVTLFQPPPTAWAIPCDEELVELDTIEHLGLALQPGQSYRAIVNDIETTRFTIPKAGLGHTFIAESPIESVDVITVEGAPLQYRGRVVFGMPKGSGCSQFNGYEIRRSESNTIAVTVTHHEVADPFVVCTADFPVVESVIPLGSDFESGVEYTVTVNSDASSSFVAR